MKIIVAGGGIGGLAAAIGLLKEGHEPLVVERAPKLGFVGQGINLGANAVRALRYLGAADAVNRRAVHTRGWAYHSLAEGTLELEIPVGNRYGGEQYISTHRADLLDALISQLPEQYVRLGSTIVGVTERADGVGVVLDDGTNIVGDVLVGADGVKSVVRTHLFGDTPSQFSNFVAWRTAVPSSAAPVAAERQELRMWSGSARYLVVYPIREDLVNVSAYVPSEEAAAESWTAGGNIDELRATFDGACPEARRILDSISDPLLTGIYVQDPLEHWVSDRIALLGDAAHSMGPFSGNGGGAAIEDAVTLAIVLGRTSAPAEAAKALEEYEQRRIPRMLHLQADARLRLRYLNDPDPATPAAPTGIWAGSAKLDPTSELDFKWLYDHDPVQTARRPLSELDLEGANPLRRPEAQRAYELWRNALTFTDHAHSWKGRRAGYDRFLSGLGAAPGDTLVTEDSLGGVPVLRVSRHGAARSDRTVLHLHGGGFMMGSARSAVEVTARLAAAAGCDAVIPDYRLAPEHPHPAAVDDALAVYRALLAEQPKRRIILTGEDAGGALAVNVAVAARDNGDTQPAALFVVSPFCDLSVSSSSVVNAASNEPFLDRGFVTNLAAAYIQTADPRSPAVSPIAADLCSLPPLLVASASEEALSDDADALVSAARRAGVPTEHLTVEDSVHSFLLFDFLPESRDALERFVRLVEATCDQPVHSP